MLHCTLPLFTLDADRGTRVSAPPARPQAMRAHACIILVCAHNIYIYIYIERERERHIYIYIYIHTHIHIHIH